MTETITLEEIRQHDLIRASTKPLRFGRSWPQTNVTTKDLEFELLHRPSPKPPVGTVLTGRQLKSRAWKRGTKFCYIRRGDDRSAHERGLAGIPLYSIVELTRDGRFIWLGDSSNIRLILDDSEFVLVYRPEEESDKNRASVSVDA